MDMTSKGYQLAACLKAIEDVELERATKKEELLAGFRERLAALRITARKLQDDILAGQDDLPLEPVDLFQKVADEVDSGALDTPTTTVRMEVRP